MDYALYGVIAILVVLFFVVKKPAKDALQSNAGDLPCKKRDDFLSAAELSFYRTLGTFLQNKAVICPKVAIKEVVFIPKSVGKDYMKYFNWVSKKHVDFVLCDAVSMQVVCAVELDDKSHQKEARKQRDEFVDRVFETAKIPLFHIFAKTGYTAGEFDSILNCFTIQAQTSVSVPIQENIQVEDIQPDSSIPLCPKCGIPMIKRKAMQGANAGNEFYGCSNYPKCREITNY